MVSRTSAPEILQQHVMTFAIGNPSLRLGLCGATIAPRHEEHYNKQFRSKATNMIIHRCPKWLSLLLGNALRFVAAPAVIAIVSGIQLASAAALVNKPVYDRGSKSYFELVDASDMIKGYGANEGPTWSQANDLAREREYKGVHGRLAVVQSVETHFFLERTFEPDSESWIGLRLWCTRRTLQWSDGQDLKPGSFAAWDKNWNQDVYTCSGAGSSSAGMMIYAPIAYTRVSYGFRWIAKGSGKRFHYFFVEYPTGHP